MLRSSHGCVCILNANTSRKRVFANDVYEFTRTNVDFLGETGTEEGHRSYIRDEDLTQGRHARKRTSGARARRKGRAGRSRSPVGRQNVLQFSGNRISGNVLSPPSDERLMTAALRQCSSLGVLETGLG